MRRDPRREVVTSRREWWQRHMPQAAGERRGMDVARERTQALVGQGMDLSLSSMAVSMHRRLIQRCVHVHLLPGALTVVLHGIQ